ncbi:hypothetical protein [Pseudomonas khavaziana]|uniref:hypothetical protein n=1 Tax=Pseudomonas khavaziana TaxID=2842351 RepID=UPI001C3E1547|nr:hypothetical protein [Pseudomonas khavaziana]MBV4479598.1 hypothetical protein [Pseudomonas khavaziana]
MRYLKATAQDRSGNGKADTVFLHFYERGAGGFDELIHEAFAVDMNGDKNVDLQTVVDIDVEGKSMSIDSHLLTLFANTFLKLNWFNGGESWKRTLVVVAAHEYEKRPPNGVKLHFLERRSTVRKPTLAFQAAAYDGYGNGVLEWFTNTDVDKNGVVDEVDKELIRSLCSNFLAFKWYTDPLSAAC